VRSERVADHSPPSTTAVTEEYSYTSTHPLGHNGPVTGSLYLYILLKFQLPKLKNVIEKVVKFRSYFLINI